MNQVTIHQAFETFVSAKVSENMRKGSLYLYNHTIERWLMLWPDVLLQEIGPTHIRGFLTDLQDEDTSSSTIHGHFRRIRHFLRWCEAEDFMAAGALKNVKAPKVEKIVPSFLSEMESMDLLLGVKNSERAFAFRDYTVHLFFLITGVRLEELYMMNVEDVDLRGGFALVKHGKGRKQRMVPLGDVLPVELRRYLLKHREAPSDELALFVNDQGRRLGYLWIQKLVTADLGTFITRKLQRPGPHCLRHTACTLLLRKHKDGHAVKVIMGHSNIETTEGYMHLAFSDLQGQQRPTLDQLLKAKPRRGRPALLLEGPKRDGEEDIYGPQP